MSVEGIFIILFVIAMAVAITVRRLRLPYTVGLVLAGLLLGLVRLFAAPLLDRSLLFSIFLPGLIFEAAFHIEIQELWRNRLTITSLAFPGVIASTVLIAVALAPLANALGFFPGFTWRHALVFGALISATDPVAVVSLFRRFGIPRRLSVLIEGESLLNDGTGIVFFTLSLSIFAGAGIHPRALGLDFVTIVGMGAMIGVATGLAVSTVLPHVDDPMIEVSLTTIAAYGSFLTADHLGYSGVIATVAAGILCGNYGARSGMSPSTRVAAETFWEFVAFALNSIVFLLIGLQVPIRDLLNSWLPIIAAWLIVTLARALVVHTVWRLVGFTRERFPWPWSLVLTWGGLRGALPMVLALGLPSDFPFRQQIISMTFGVVTLSILGHGVTMLPLLHRLGIVRAEVGDAAYELLRGELQTAVAALEEIERLALLHSLAPDALEELKTEYQERIARLREEMGKLIVAGGPLRTREVQQARQHLLLVEKKRAIDAYNRGVLSLPAHDRLLADLDARLLELESSDTGEPQPDASPTVP
jgi:CPA1 family monovalent cation:H+ antiporter